MLSRRVHLCLLPLLLLALILGLGRLFQLRFAHGDVLPKYSTYRADPLGAMAIYRALEEMPGVEVSRFHEQRYRKLPNGRDHTLVMLAVEPAQLLHMYLFSIEKLELFMRQGGRVVVGIKPYPTKGFWEIQVEKSRERSEERRRDHKKKRKKSKSAKKDDDEPFDPEEEEENIRKNWMNEWGIDLLWTDLKWDDEFTALPETVVREADSPRELPGMLEWHSAGVFSIPGEIEDLWRVHYRRGEEPVLIERKIGKGSVVLATDPYVFSNEALRDDRHTPLLAWLLADSHHVVFDESHLGMVRNEGVVTLGRKYQLHGLAVGLIILGLLFVWKNGSSLVPPLDDVNATGSAVAGRDSNVGFLNLLRRTVKPADLIPTCIAEWRKSHPHLQEKGAALERMAGFDRNQKDLVGRYHELRELIKPRIK